jgi:hypothetical protein
MVIVQNKGAMLLQDVKLGDLVLNAYGQYDLVYSWAHFAPRTEAVFLKIKVTGMMQPLELSPNHMLFKMVKGRDYYCHQKIMAVPASSLVEGDRVMVVGANVAMATIQSIQRVVRRGAFAPFTMSGTIAVNHIACSVYVDLQQGSSPGVLELNGHATPFSTHFASHVFQSSHRIICKMCSYCNAETHDNRGISNWVTTPLLTAEWLLHPPQQLQYKLVSSIILASALGVALLVYGVEQILAARGPVIFVLLLVLWAVIHRRNRRLCHTSKIQ